MHSLNDAEVCVGTAVDDADICVIQGFCMGMAADSVEGHTNVT